MQFNQHTTSQLGHHDFHKLANFLTGTPSSFNFAVPGELIRIAGFRILLRGFRARRLSLEPNLTLNLAKIRVRYSPQK